MSNINARLCSFYNFYDFCNLIKLNKNIECYSELFKKKLLDSFHTSHFIFLFSTTIFSLSYYSGQIREAQEAMGRKIGTLPRDDPKGENYPLWTLSPNSGVAETNPRQEQWILLYAGFATTQCQWPFVLCLIMCDTVPKWVSSSMT